LLNGLPFWEAHFLARLRMMADVFRSCPQSLPTFLTSRPDHYKLPVTILLPCRTRVDTIYLLMKQFSTLKKLSEKLGLSISTVSRALKDHPDISPATRKRVKDLAELTEYEPNTFALNLRSNSSKIIGIIVPFLQNLFYEYFISSLDEEVRKEGFSLLILQSGESVEAEIKNLHIMKKNRVDLLFASLTENTENIDPFLKLSGLGIPIVFFDRVPAYETCDKIRFADKEAGTISARRLIKSRKKNILCLCTDSPNLSNMSNRINAFRETFNTFSPESRIDFYFQSDLKKAEQKTVRSLRKKYPPDAFFCIGDNSLIRAMKGIQKEGLEIPKDIGVIAISNGFIPTLYNPAITFVETNGYKLGKLAFHRMKEILSGKTIISELISKVVLVEGRSI
jgi:LacI family transcriptional regulator